MTQLIRRASAEARAFGSKRQDKLDKQDKKQGKRFKRERDDDLDDAPRIDIPRKPRFAPVTFSEEDGVRFLHFGTEWVQGGLRLKNPTPISIEYAQQMMAWLWFIETPKRIVQLGLGRQR